MPRSSPEGPVRTRVLAVGGGPVGGEPPAGQHQGHRIGRVRLADAGCGVVGQDPDDRAPLVQPWEQLPEEGPVDRGDHVALVLRPPVVGRDVGALDMDVEGLVAVERVGRQARPTWRRPPRRPGRTRSDPGGARRRASIPRAIEIPRSTGISTKQPQAHPNRSRIDWSVGRRSPPSRVRIRSAGSLPSARRAAFTGTLGEHCGRALDERVREVGGAARGVGVVERFGAHDHRVERLERDPEVALRGDRRGRCW